MVDGRHGEMNVLHYLNFFGSLHSMAWEDALQISLALCQLLRFPITSHKVEGLANNLTFLEIRRYWYSWDCLHKNWLGCKSLLGSGKDNDLYTKRDLLSLIGHLSHACRVVKPRHTFLRLQYTVRLLLIHDLLHILITYSSISPTISEAAL